MTTFYALVRWLPNDAYNNGYEYIDVEKKSVLHQWDMDDYELLCDDLPKDELYSLKKVLEKSNDNQD